MATLYSNLLSFTEYCQAGVGEVSLFEADLIAQNGGIKGAFGKNQIFSV